MPDIKIVPALKRHVKPVAARMRQPDVDELQAASGRTPKEALLYSIDHSEHSWTALIDGKPEAIFGVGILNVIGGVGAPWLLATDEVERNRRVFVRLSISFRNELLERYPVLRNFVDVRNTASIRWLRWMGAEFSEPVLIRDHPFRMFEMRRNDV
jgi:hypothetical protein